VLFDALMFDRGGHVVNVDAVDMGVIGFSSAMAATDWICGYHKAI